MSADEIDVTKEGEDQEVAPVTTEGEEETAEVAPAGAPVPAEGEDAPAADAEPAV